MFSNQDKEISRKDIVVIQNRSPSEQAAAILRYAQTHNRIDCKFSVSSSYITQSYDAKRAKVPDMASPVTPVLRFDSVLRQLEKLEGKDTACVLNFGSYLNGGGEFGQGCITTDEEKLCACSNLYVLLHSAEIQKKYYDVNNNAGKKKPYGARILYLPEVVFYGAERDIRADVITCSIPGTAMLRQHIENADMVMKTTMVHRFTTALGHAYLQGADVVIMGCFGCELNGNDPWYSYSVLQKVVHEKYRYCFKKIIVAVNDRRYLAIREGERKTRVNHPPLSPTA